MSEHEIKVGTIVLDADGYQAEVVKIENGIATLDYTEFDSDVPPETTEWPVESLEFYDFDIDDEIARRESDNLEGDPDTEF